MIALGRKKIEAVVEPGSLVFRWAQFMLGLFLWGVAVSLMIRSGLGLGPWDAFHIGVHKLTGLSVGVASIVVGIVIVGGSYLVRVRPGPGTLANMVLIGVFIDLLLPITPAAQGWVWAFGYYVVALVIAGVATGMYIAPGFGKGPRDGLMIGLSVRFNRPVRRVRTIVELFVLACGWMMGGTIGVGTVLFALTIGPVMQWGLRLYGMSSTGEPQICRAEYPTLKEAA